MRQQFMVIVAIILTSCFLVELFLSLKMNKKIYPFRETLANLIQGIGQQVSNLAIIPLFLLAYDYVCTNYALFEINPQSIFNWVIVVFAIDLTYYTGHRASHRINIFLATHIVHHQSHTYNLGSAMRQSWTGRLGMFPFFICLAFIGFPTHMTVLAQLCVMVVQYFAHSGLVKRDLGFLEYIFMTPLNHRVHHGVNEYYIDRNFGGIFIFWDKMFGTYRKYNEEIPIEYPEENIEYSQNPIKANLDYYLKLYSASRIAKDAKMKFWIWFGKPEHLTESKGKSTSMHLVELSQNQKRVVVFLFAVSSLLMMTLMHYSVFVSTPLLVTAILFQILFISYISHKMRPKTTTRSEHV